jgi:hypothetical protein
MAFLRTLPMQPRTNVLDEKLDQLKGGGNKVGLSVELAFGYDGEENPKVVTKDIVGLAFVDVPDHRDDGTYVVDWDKNLPQLINRTGVSRELEIMSNPTKSITPNDQSIPDTFFSVPFSTFINNNKNLTPTETNEVNGNAIKNVDEIPTQPNVNEIPTQPNVSETPLQPEMNKQNNQLEELTKILQIEPENTVVVNPMILPDLSNDTKAKDIDVLITEDNTKEMDIDTLQPVINNSIDTPTENPGDTIDPKELILEPIIENSNEGT